MADDADAYVPTLLYCLDGKGVDRLLEKLRTVHGEPRYDIAPELRATTRRAVNRFCSSTVARRVEQPMS
jgi:hypothetical protein